MCDRFFDLGNREARRDVLRTVPVECDDLDKEKPLHDALDIPCGRLRDQRRMSAHILDAGVAEEFQALATRLVHEEDRDAVVDSEIAGRKHLAVSLVIGKCKLRRAQDPQETALPTPAVTVW